MVDPVTAISVGSNVLGGLFGKKKKSGGGAQTAYMLLPANVRAAVDDYFKRAQDIASTPYQPYTGERIAPLSGDELAAIDYGRQNFGLTAPTIMGANALNQQLIGRAAAGPTTEALQGFMNPYQQLVIDQAKTRSTEDFQKVLGNIRTQAANAGAFGGSRQALLESNAFRDLGRNLTEIQERGSQQGFTNAQDMFFRTLGQAGDLNQQAVSTALTGQSAINQDINQRMRLGQAQRGIDQAMLDQDYLDFANEINYPTQSLNVLGTALQNTAPYFAPYQMNQGGGSSQNGFGQAMGAVSQIAGLFKFSKGGQVKTNNMTQAQDSGLTFWDRLFGRLKKDEDTEDASAENEIKQLLEEKAYERKIDELNTEIMNEVGGRLSNVQMQNISSPYADLVTQGTGFAGTTRQNLFQNFQEGGLVSGFDFMNFGGSREAGQAGLNPKRKKVKEETNKPTGLQTLVNTPEQARALAQIIGDRLNLPSPQNVGSLPEVGIPKLDKSALNEQLLAGVVGTPTASNTNETENDINDLGRIIEALGLTPPKPKKQERSLLTALELGLAGSGLLPTRESNIMLARIADRQGISLSGEKKEKDTRAEKLQALELALKLKDLQKGRMFADIQRQQMLMNLASGNSGGTSPFGRPTPASIENALTDLQKQRTYLAMSVGESSPSVQDLDKQIELRRRQLREIYTQSGLPSE